MEVWCAENDVHYVFGRFRADGTDRALLERHGFALVETTLALTSGPHVNLPRVPKSLRPTLSPAREDQVDEIAAIAEADFQHGRYIEDPLINEAAAGARNGYWLRDLYEEGCLLVAEHRQRIVGFHCDRVNRDGHNAQLVLAGVRSGAEMYALPMWVEALSRLQDTGVTRPRPWSPHRISAFSTSMGRSASASSARIWATGSSSEEPHRPTAVRTP